MSDLAAGPPPPDERDDRPAPGPPLAPATHDSLQPEPSNRVAAVRRRLGWRSELALAALPTATVLVVLGLVETLSDERLLFASLASSAFLIYLDPEHGTNKVRVLMASQTIAALLGWATWLLLGPGYMSAGSAMVLTIILMVVLDVVHPPAVSTSISFALRAEDTSDLMLFALAVGITAILVLLQRAAVWSLGRLLRRR